MKKNKIFKRKKPQARTYRPKQKSAASKGYDSDWRKYRYRFLHYNPKCYRCGSKSEVVDHLRAHKGDEKLFRQLDNHIPLCTKCHNYITAKYDKFKDPKTQEKINDIIETRKLLNVNVRVRVLPSYQSRKRRGK